MNHEDMLARLVMQAVAEGGELVTLRAIVEEASGQIARVHDLRELRRALLARTPMILLSPIHPTASHPGWLPIPRMRAAALARLARRQLIALGGMDDTRFRRIAPLGFQGWAGISAWLLRT